jgi:ribonuclease J
MADRARKTLNFRPGRQGGSFLWVANHEGLVVGLCSDPLCPEGCRNRLGADFAGGPLEVDLEHRLPYGTRSTEFYLAHLVRRVSETLTAAIQPPVFGGLSESDGTGLTAVCYVDSAGEALMVDCGLPPGQNGGKLETLRQLLAEPGLRGVAITHGHFDHWSLTSEVGELPVFVGQLTNDYIARQVERGFRTAGGGSLEVPFSGPKTKRLYDLDSPFEVGGFKIHPALVAHSIPDAAMFLIRTPSGKRVLHFGEGKFRGLDWASKFRLELRLEEIGRQGIDLMYIDNLNAHAAGYTAEETNALQGVGEVIAHAKGRVVVAMFASNLDRLAILASAARDFGRPTFFEGASMLSAHGFAFSRGYDLPPGGEPMDRSVIFVTGCQAEPYSVLDREFNGKGRPPLWLHGGDTVVFSSRVIPGNEEVVGKLVKRVHERGCTSVLHEGEAAKLGLTPSDRIVEKFVHVSGHGSAEDVRLAMKIVRPKRVVPSVLTSPQIEAFREIAASEGIEVLEAPGNRIVL